MRGGAEEESDQPPNTSLSPQGNHPQSKTPPLSAAQSQMSLTTSSDLTASDPDLISSSSASFGSSRPPSSSSGVASPDILHAIQQEETGDPNHVTPTNTEPLGGSNGAESLVSTPKVMIRVPTETEGSAEGSPPSEAEEEYFEEYHLPNTHENAFVRHRSYRRKVEANPIDAPDADKIQDLVMTGELERHGSVRRKIVPSQSLLRAPDEEDEGSFSDEEPGTSIHPLEEDEMTVGVGEYIGDKGPKSLNVHEFSREFRHIRKMMDDPEAVDVDSESEQEEEEYIEEVPQFELRGETAFSSTPHGGYASTANYKNNKREESMNIEQSTMNKVKECMDFSKYKDIYSISGKLQDILTPVEVEEVLNNSHRYVDCIDSGVLEALFNSVSEKMSMTGQPMSISFTKPEEKKMESPVEPLTKEQEDLRKQIKQKLLMEELAMDSLPYIKNDSDSQLTPDTSEVVMRKKVSPQSSVDSDSSRFGTIERRKSIRISKGKSQIDLESVFIESDFKDSNMKRIEAPSIDLMASNSQDDLDISDPKSDDQDVGTAVEEVLSKDATDLDLNGVENSSVNNLYFEESAESGSSEGLQSTLQKSVDHPLGDVEEAVDAVGTIDGGRKIPTPPPFMSLPPDGTEDGEGHWRTVVIGGVWRRIDMKVIEPYKKCINSGGFLDSHSVVVVSACQLPDRSRSDYSYVMDNLFVYLLSRLEQLVADDYILVYLSGGRNISSTGPSFHWLKAAYQMIDRKLKKNLQALLVVHPTLWTRTIVALTRPFISSKFYRKLSFVYSLTELAQMIPLDQLDIPDSVKEADFELMIKEKKKNGGRRR